MKAHIKRIGNWPAFARLAANLTNELNRAYYLSLRRWGLKAEAIAKGHISTQDLANTTWAPLSTRHLQYKSRKGYSLDTYVMTSTYFQNITTWVDRVAGECYVGVKRGVMHKADGVVQPLDELARTLEYGFTAHNLPARPLWEPTLNETMQWHLKFNRPGTIFLDILRKKYV